MTTDCVIGVTGLPCSGKSRAAELIASGGADGEGALLLKADDMGHEALARPEVAAALRARFGDAAGDTADPAAMRRAVAARVFADPAELDWLERLVHPLVAEETLRRIDRARASGTGGRAVIEAALLFAAGMDGICGRVLVIEAPFALRLSRARGRGWDENELRRRERRLLPLFADARNGERKNTLVKVNNDGSIEALRDGLRAALRRPLEPHS